LFDVECDLRIDWRGRNPEPDPECEIEVEFVTITAKEKFQHPGRPAIDLKETDSGIR
jgi:hypothetical protein